MKIAIVDGYYSVISAMMVDDPIHDFFTAYMFQGVLNSSVCIGRYRNSEPVEVVTLQCNSVDVYEPGWIFVEDSVTNLRKRKNSNKLFLELKTPDDKILRMLINLRQLGYGIESPLTNDTVCEFLISTPIPPDGGSIDRPSYISTDYMQSLCHDARKS